MSPYQDQWSRVYALFREGRLSAKDMMEIAKRHHQWFLREGVFDATPLMTEDVRVFANHLEEFAERLA